jgi:phosphoenolpyruvate-protein phosphotransferase
MMNGTLELSAPFSGLAIPLASVRDPVFSGLVMGDGLAIEPLSSTLLSPCDGVVTHLAKTGHALTVTANNGAEVLIHVGIDTVRLGGKGFITRIRQGDSVRRGQELVDVDIDVVARAAPSLHTMVVITGEGFSVGRRASGIVRAGQPGFLSVRPGKPKAAAVERDGPELRGNATVGHGGGLHARPSALVQAAARRFSADVVLEFEGRVADSRSVTALMGLGVGEGEALLVRARGADAAEALAAVIEAVQLHSEAGHKPAAPVMTPAVDDAASAASGWRGQCAAPGLAVGQVARLDDGIGEIPEQGGGIDAEFASLVRALTAVRAEIEQAVREAEKRNAAAEAEIFSAHLALADDPELIVAAERGILQGQGAGFAFCRAVAVQCELLTATGNALLAERAGDLRDLQRRVLAAMGLLRGGVPVLSEHSIVIAGDLTPSQLSCLPRERLAGLATVRGGVTSHVAIIARALGIPALVAVGPRLLTLEAGREIVLDADGGAIEPSPTNRQLQDARAAVERGRMRREQMRQEAALAARTLDGVVIEVAANIASEADAREAVAMGADGVGLLRTEFLFIGRSELPTSAEQQRAYQAVLDALQGRPAIIRTMDVGGDKEVPYLSLPHEDNPALGLRGIRTGFAQPAILDDQLRGLLAVKPLSQLRILIPMIADVGEVLRVRQRIDALADEMGLGERPQLGVMIEVPSAALLAEQLARHVDFFSIGTNDLTQYTLAMDRCHPVLAGRLDPLHPALLRLIAMTVDGARKHGRWVGMCGGMASDAEAVPVLIGLGVSELSVSPPLVPEIKARVRHLSWAECEDETAPLLGMSSAEDVRAALRVRWPAAART